MSDWIKVIILGVVEGVTEFLPISSTGHLIVFSNLLDLHERLRVTFEICIQLGAVVAVLAYYRDDLLWQVRHVRERADVRRLWLGIVVAVVPFAVIGLLLRAWIGSVLFTPIVVALALIAGGVVLLAVERRRGPELPAEMAGRSEQGALSISVRQALVVGLAQLAALIPGVSRSAASIVGGMGAGMSRTSATEFSFLVAIPTLGGATVYELLRSLSFIHFDDLGYLLVGSLVASVVAWAAVRWLLRYISRNSFAPFAYYRIIAGIIVLLLIAAQVLPNGFAQ